MMEGFTPQLITIADIVRENRRALADGSLFATQRTVPDATACAYDEDGLRCAIGVILTDTTLGAVKAKHLNKRSAVGRLRAARLVTFPDDGTYEIAHTTQRLHDAWAAKAGADDISWEAQAFLENHLVGSRENFEAWLDFLARTYLQGQSGAQSATDTGGSGGGGTGPYVSGEVAVLP